RRVERALGAHRVATVGLALQAREIEEQRRTLTALLARLAGLALVATRERREELIHPCAVEDAGGLDVPVVAALDGRIEPAALPPVLPPREDPDQLPVGPRDVGEDLVLALDEQVERGGLDAARRPRAALA